MTGGRPSLCRRGAAVSPSLYSHGPHALTTSLIACGALKNNNNMLVPVYKTIPLHISHTRDHPFYFQDIS